jgi:hypothetical protein
METAGSTKTPGTFYQGTCLHVSEYTTLQLEGGTQIPDNLNLVLGLHLALDGQDTFRFYSVGRSIVMLTET